MALREDKRTGTILPLSPPQPGRARRSVARSGVRTLSSEVEQFRVRAAQPGGAPPPVLEL